MQPKHNKIRQATPELEASSLIGRYGDKAVNIARIMIKNTFGGKVRTVLFWRRTLILLERKERSPRV